MKKPTGQIGGKGTIRRKHMNKRGPKDAKGMLDECIAKNKLMVNEIGGMSSIYISDHGVNKLHFNYPNVRASPKASVYVVFGEPTEVMKDDDNNDNNDNGCGDQCAHVVRQPNKWERKFHSLVEKSGVKIEKLPYHDVMGIVKDTKFSCKSCDIYKLSNDLYLIYGLLEKEEQEVKPIINPVALEDDEVMPALTSVQSTTSGNQIHSEVDNDVDMVMQQTNVSRERAIEALSQHNNDIIEAIMSLT
jgi:NACalpha-BTF3-like transcription factor